MHLLWWILGTFVLLYLVQSIYLGVVLKWEDERTAGLGYYGRPPAEREGFKRQLRMHAVLLAPLLWLNGRLARMDFRRASMSYKGVAGPAGSCTPETFARAEQYQPCPEDIFVVTQMKCGTTWMQHVVYEVLNRGTGNLVASGTEIYAVSPWIEGRRSVSIDQAPLIGAERPSRIIKTHLPGQLCPASAQARYIYVARHPVSCFASCVDFVATNVGRMAPPPAAFEEWYCSPELMWWGTWTDHVRGWWDRSQKDGNVLFLYFEDLKRDLPGIVRQVAGFLGVKPLTDQELEQVVEKCGFAYMQEHKNNFEMQPPHVMQTNADLFVRGTATGTRTSPPKYESGSVPGRRSGLDGSAFPLRKAYPDVSGEAGEVGTSASGPIAQGGDNGAGQNSFSGIQCWKIRASSPVSCDRSCSGIRRSGPQLTSSRQPGDRGSSPGRWRPRTMGFRSGGGDQEALSHPPRRQQAGV